MSEIVFLQIGQCGNQIGWKFWEKALEEHIKYQKEDPTDTSYNSFFEIGEKGSFENMKQVRARAVLVDAETNVTNQLQASKIGDIFRGCSVAVDNGGAGNNWSVGYYERGPQQGETVLERIRHLAEHSPHLESFFMLYSLGGGTGSGFGSYLLEALADEYPKQWKMATVVTPTDNDTQVVTAPYNSALSCAHLCKYANCVFPVENAALQHFVTVDPDQDQKKAFDQMNTVVANFLLDLTAGSRFSGSMNVDLREIQTNMIPFPNHKFLVSGISPIDLSKPPRNITGFFTEAMSQKAALCDFDPHCGTYLAAALLSRGDVALSTLRSSIDRLGQKMRFPSWNHDGWKIGICANQPLYTKFSLLTLANTSAVDKIFDTMISRFNKLFLSKAYLKHYTDNMEIEELAESVQTLQFVADEYQSICDEPALPRRPRIIA